MLLLLPECHRVNVLGALRQDGKLESERSGTDAAHRRAATGLSFCR